MYVMRSCAALRFGRQGKPVEKKRCKQDENPFAPDPGTRPSETSLGLWCLVSLNKSFGPRLPLSDGSYANQPLPSVSNEHHADLEYHDLIAGV